MLAYPIAILAIENEADRLFMQQLYEDYYRIMCAQVYGVLNEQQHIDDVISEALIALMDRIHILTQMERPVLRAYVVSTTRNASINFARRQNLRRKHIVSDPDPVFETQPCDDAEIDTGLLVQEEVARVQRAILKLPDYERRVLQMKYFQDLSNDEIARQLDIKPDSVRKYLLRARRRTLEIME